MCLEAADATDSPDLGPPPISRYVEEALAKPESPSKYTGDARVDASSQSAELLQSRDGAEAEVPQSQPEGKVGETEAPMWKDEVPLRQKQEDAVKNATAPHTSPSSRPKGGGKRKYNDEIELAESRSTAAKADGAKPAAGRVPSRTIKEISSKRREAKVVARVQNVLGGRRPLAPKNSNEDISSPKKSAKGTVLDDFKPARIEPLRESSIRGSTRGQAGVEQATIAPPAPVIAAIIPEPAMAEPETPFPEEHPIAPDTPERSAPRDVARDTPPPADISAQGETSRANRRSRAAVSYAEPNLRDKMRRPTKDLVDAVTGESRYTQRTKSDDAAHSASKPKEPGSGLLNPWDSQSIAKATAKDSTRRESVLSPLAQKEAPSTDLAMSTGVTERSQRRASSVASRQSLAVQDLVADGDVVKESGEDAKTVQDSVSAHGGADLDVYDFSSSSLLSEPKEEQIGHNRLVSSGKGSSRRASTAAHGSRAARPTEPGGRNKGPVSRKRASVTAPRRAALSGDTDTSDVSGDEVVERRPDASARERISRRRSMML